MAQVPLPALLHFLANVADGREAADLTDGELLECFRHRRDEAAFAALLHRHGPLVLGVCHRLLHNPHDAEDAFQATFLLLLRRAHAIVKEGSVASWLHGVAHRVAVRLKDDNARRRRRERQAVRPPAADLLQQVLWRDLRAMLDEEVLRLPARCREPFILCFLEGKTNAQAARLLGCPTGTVQSRLAHARELLRAGLSRRGLALSGGLLATMLPQPAAPAASVALVEATVRMARVPLTAEAGGAAVSARVFTLAEGALATMLPSKIKVAVAVVLIAGVLAAAAGAPAWIDQPDLKAPPAPVQTAKGDPAGPADVRKALRDPDPQVRLKAALALTRAEELDEQAITTLIELLAVLPPAQRRQAERALQQVAEEWSPTPALTGDDEISRRILRDAWAGWWRNVDGQALLAAFKKRTLTPEQTARAVALIADLGDKDYATRQRAAAELVALGPPVVSILRQAQPGAELEVALRLEQCLKQIAENQDGDTLPAVAARLLVLRKPAGATAALLAYIGCVDDEVMKWEVAKALQRLAGAGTQVDADLIKALQDAAPMRRAVAGESLAAVADDEVRSAVRKLLADVDLAVRLRVAVALVCVGDRQAVPPLIDLLADAPADQWWRAEEILHELAGAMAPPPGAGDDAASRQKCRDAWRAWCAAHGANVKLSPRPVPPPLLGFTTIAACLPAPNNTKSLVIEVDRHGKVRWQFDCHYPVDVHVLPGNRVLVSEYDTKGKRVTERDFKGNILWQKTDLVESYNVQRLANGHTFVACRLRLLEFDAAGKTVFDQPIEESVGGGKLPDGQMVYLTIKGKCVRLDAAGKEVGRFDSGQDDNAVRVLDMTPRGNLLVSLCPKSAAAEFDLEGNKLWQARTPHFVGIPTVARNGHKVVGLYAQSNVVELDRSGKVVWEYATSGYLPFMARRR
jgi:RNA polymerase sigma factor (sigma-70 family)